jgi:predicted branched-subunit amino acid permease
MAQQRVVYQESVALATALSRFVYAGTCLPSHVLAMDVSSGSTIPAFGCHVTLLFVDIRHLLAGISKCILSAYEPLSFSDQTFLKLLLPSVKKNCNSFTFFGNSS